MKNSYVDNDLNGIQAYFSSQSTAKSPEETSEDDSTNLPRPRSFEKRRGLSSKVHIKLRLRDMTARLSLSGCFDLDIILSDIELLSDCSTPATSAESAQWSLYPRQSVSATPVDTVKLRPAIRISTFRQELPLEKSTADM